MLEALETASILLVAIGLPLTAAELIWLWRRRELNRRRWKEIGASLSPLVPAVLTEALSLALWFGIYTAVARVIPWSLPITPLVVVGAIVLADFLYYWGHRIEHRVAWLWALQHSVHHSSPTFDQSTAYRISFIDNFTVPAYYLPLVLVGFDPLLVVLAAAVGFAYQTWIHTELIRRLPAWFEAVFNTASHHRVHHGADDIYLDKNYGAILIIWDRMFGTFQAEQHRPRYGLTTPIGSANPIDVHLIEIRRLWARLRREPSWNRRIEMLWRPPGWVVPVSR